jgi:prepilin-type N-terminal cleavage/methylation domain-containing protein
MDIIDIETTEKRQDKGFTLVELLIVIVILGILATVTVFAVRGITDKGQTSACNTDKATLQTAVESYFAQYGTTTGIASGAIAAGTTFASAAAATTAGGFQTSATIGNPAVTAVTAPSSASWTAGLNPQTTLVNAGFLRAVPANYWVAQDGSLYSQNASCGALGTKVG